jgi:hypothetical protein
MIQFQVLVAGTSFNKDAVSYARKEGKKSLRIRRDLRNKYDPNCITVSAMNSIGDWTKIGHVPNSAYCLVCNPTQKKSAGPVLKSYELPKVEGKIDPDFPCPDCGTKGKIDPGTADKIAPYMDAGRKVDGRIISFLGGTEGKENTGILISLEVETDEDM